MQKLSLVNESDLRDVTKLPYLYPRMPLIRYKKLSMDYHEKMAIQAAEQVARANDCYLLPVSCIHHKRRDQTKRIVIRGKSYYLMHVDEMTVLEYEKFKLVCATVEDVAI